MRLRSIKYSLKKLASAGFFIWGGDITGILDFMRRGSVQFFILLLIAVALFSGGFYYQKTQLDANTANTQDRTKVAEVEEHPTSTVESAHVAEEVTANEPLRGPVFSEPAEVPGDLSVSGVLTWTNTYRADAGLAPLQLNIKLSAAAALKVRDMFDKQYFDHESPIGVGTTDLADTVGYGFVLVGENLALGIFKDDQDLVDAWMASPGHRANVLHNRFTEIGIAVMKGAFEGEETWIAVQEFGLPRSACPEPSTLLKNNIEENQSTLAGLSTDIQVLRNELDDASVFDSNYNTVVKTYNMLVERYNKLVRETKSRIDQYNAQVRSFNACASGT